MLEYIHRQTVTLARGNSRSGDGISWVRIEQNRIVFGFEPFRARCTYALRYALCVLGYRSPVPLSSWVKLDNYINLTKHLLCFRTFQSKILPFLVYFTLNVFSAIIQILVAVKICVSVQFNASVFVFVMLVPQYYFNKLCLIAAPY